MNNHILLEKAIDTLKQSGNEFAVLFQHGSLSVELYKPDGVDKQLPHTRDEAYLIVSGTGKFNLEDEITTVAPGDFLFVPAKARHHFFDFTVGFTTWVLFYGPEGGENQP
jgi:mannose-6-phosphate isomerase-like protein (cupin superfamily)